MFPKCLFCQVSNEQCTGALGHCVYFIINLYLLFLSLNPQKMPLQSKFCINIYER